MYFIPTQFEASFFFFKFHLVSLPYFFIFSLWISLRFLLSFFIFTPSCLIKCILIYITQQPMKNIFITILCLASLLLASANSSESSNRFLQITTRSASVGKFCASGVDRTTLVSAQAKTDSQANSATMKSSFPMSGNELIGSILADKNNILGGLVAQLPNIATQLGIFAGPFVIGFVLTFLLWPFLCCCCCCPSCCPSKCCQKSETEQYTKCELIWPSIVLILALLLMIIGSVIGITRAGDIQNTYKTVGCAAAITIDDVINGNISTAGTYFMGVQGLSNSLTQLKGNLGAVDSNLNAISYANTGAGNTLRSTYNQGTALLNLISQVPTGTAGQTSGFTGYKHFDGTGAVGAVPSTVPTALGTALVGSKSGAVGTAHTVVDGINEGIKTIGTNADSFKGQMGSISGIIDSIVDKIGAISTPISGVDTTVSGLDDQATPIMKIVTIAVTAIFGAFIGLGVLSIIGTLLMTFCDKFSCRYLLYFVCIILLILGILSFLLATLFSIITPILYLGCDFLTTSLSSSVNFNTNVGKILDPSVTNYLAVCLPGGSGDLIAQLGVDLTGINGLTNSISSMRNFDSSQLENGVDQAITTLENLFNQYYYSDILDFSSASDQTLLSNLLNVGTTYSGCTTNGFQTDRWVPSIRLSSPSFSCSGTTTTATNTQCSSTATVSTNPTTSTCKGCLDTTKIIFETYSGADPTADLNTRYSAGAGDCLNWKNAFTPLYTNYYSPKYVALNPIKGRITGVKTSFNTASTGYKAKINNLGSTFTSTINSLTGVVSAVVDPQYGLIAGLNCLLLGDDLNLVISATCTSFFNTFYFLRFTLGLAAFGILFTLCCTTCSGVRAYKHMSRKGSILPKDGMNQESTMAALNNKY